MNTQPNGELIHSVRNYEGGRSKWQALEKRHTPGQHGALVAFGAANALSGGVGYSERA